MVLENFKIYFFQNLLEHLLKIMIYFDVIVKSVDLRFDNLKNLLNFMKPGKIVKCRL